MYRKYFSLLTLALLVSTILVSTLAQRIAFSFSAAILILTAFTAFIFNRAAKKEYQNYRSGSEELEMRLNLLEEELKTKGSILRQLPHKSKRILSIKDIAQKFIDTFEPEDVKKAIVTSLSELFIQADHILLFLFHRNKDTLFLEQSFKRQKEVIREKKGDNIDWWVLKNNQSLLIKELQSDYRFDSTRITALRERGAHSIASSPLSIGHKVIGVVRIESKKSNAFSLEGSRLLRIVCDLAAAVLERAELFKKTKELATKDSLTSLMLRSYFFERVEEEIRRASLKKTQFGIVILDIDNFKKINDTYGHIVGDMALKKLAAILKRTVGDSGNLICRIGGEEFVFVIVEANKKQVKEIAEKVRSDTQGAVLRFRRKNINFTLSMGLAMYPDDGIDFQQLLAVSDKLLYKAKEKGKNRVCCT